MTSRQLAIAAGAEVKWLLNSAALLGRRVGRTPADARWWGLVRLLTEGLGLSLQTAAAAATRSLRGGAPTRQVTVSADPSESTSLLVDLPRYQSIFIANLSRALVQETPRRRGRPSRSRSRTGAIDAAIRYGVDLGLARAALDRTPAQRLEMLEANARFLREMKRQRT
jgi:hypothetical protein